MHDTPPEVAALYRAMLMRKTPEERLRMGDDMLACARAFVLASLPPDLSGSEKRAQLFLRFYGQDFDPAERERICLYLRQPTS